MTFIGCIHTTDPLLQSGTGCDLEEWRARYKEGKMKWGRERKRVKESGNSFEISSDIYLSIFKAYHVLRLTSSMLHITAQREGIKSFLMTSKLLV